MKKVIAGIINIETGEIVEKVTKINLLNDLFHKAREFYNKDLEKELYLVFNLQDSISNNFYQIKKAINNDSISAPFLSIYFEVEISKQYDYIREIEKELETVNKSEKTIVEFDCDIDVQTLLLDLTGVKTMEIEESLSNANYTLKMRVNQLKDLKVKYNL